MRKRLLNWLSVTFMLLLTVTGVSSSVAAKLDHKHPNYVRAVLINKITPYIYWQQSSFSSANAPINLCIIESQHNSIDKIWPYLNVLSTRKFSGRSYALKNISRYKDHPEKLPDNCHIYYLASVDVKHSRALFKKARKLSVLTIADTMEELNRGAMMAFIEERGKMKIYVNTRAINNSHLKVKSSLLRIAKKI